MFEGFHAQGGRDVPQLEALALTLMHDIYAYKPSQNMYKSLVSVDVSADASLYYLGSTNHSFFFENCKEFGSKMYMLLCSYS